MVIPSTISSNQECEYNNNYYRNIALYMYQVLF